MYETFSQRPLLFNQYLVSAYLNLCKCRVYLCNNVKSGLFQHSRLMSSVDSIGYWIRNQKTYFIHSETTSLRFSAHNLLSIKYVHFCLFSQVRQKLPTRKLKHTRCKVSRNFSLQQYFLRQPKFAEGHRESGRCLNSQLIALITADRRSVVEI